MFVLSIGGLKILEILRRAIPLPREIVSTFRLKVHSQERQAQAEPSCNLPLVGRQPDEEPERSEGNPATVSSPIFCEGKKYL